MKGKKIGSTLINQKEIIFYNLDGHNCQWHPGSDMAKKRNYKIIFNSVLSDDCNGEYMQNKQTKEHTH